MGLLDLFRRSPAPTPVRAVRSLDAGAQAKRRGLPVSTGVNSETALALIAQRARGAYLNRAHIRAAVDAWVDGLIGPGVEPVSADAAALARWREWSRNINLVMVLRVLVREMVICGEGFAAWSGDRPILLPSSQLADESRTLADGGLIHRGVEVDALGDPVAFHIYPARPEAGRWSPPVRVEAADVLHLFEQIEPGQIRGLSWLTAALLPANELDGLLDALVVRARVAAAVVGFIRSMEGAPLELDGETPSLEPGTLWRLGAGEDVTFCNPTPSAENGALVAVKIREIASAMGLPSHLVDGDLTGANYSSLRAGLLPFRARVEAVQFGTIVPRALAPMWRRVTLTEAPDEWIMPAQRQVDPLKAIQSDLAELTAGLTTRRRLAAERGWSLDQLDAELAAEGWKPTEESPDAA